MDSLPPTTVIPEPALTNWVAAADADATVVKSLGAALAEEGEKNVSKRDRSIILAA